MKVSAANQTLILANDGPTGGKPPASVSQSSRAASNGGNSQAALQRVTVGVELPDSTVVYVHADYGSRSPADRVVSPTDTVPASSSNTTSTVADSAPNGAASLVQLSAPAYNKLLRASDTSRDVSGNPHSSNENVALYARTQRLNGAAKSSSLVDVLA